VQEAVDMAQLMAGEGRRMYGQTVPSELRDKFAMSLRQPIGVCGDDHRLEFSDRRAVLEDLSRAGVRQHGRLQACRGSAGLGDQLRAGARWTRVCPRAS
jgi:hypothetical protein